MIDLRHENGQTNQDHSCAHFLAPILVSFQIVFLVVCRYQLFVTGLLFKLTCYGSLAEADDQLCELEWLVKHHGVLAVFDLEQLGATCCKVSVILNDHFRTFRPKLVSITERDSNREVNVWVS